MRPVLMSVFVVALAAGHADAFDIVNRWTTTQFDGPGIERGDPITLFWSIVPDGQSYERSANSNLIDYLDDGWSVPLLNRTPTLNNRPWWAVIKSAYDQYERVSGLRMAYRAEQNALGQNTGLRGDIRIGGEVIDQDPGGVLADNTFPNAGDMRIDTSRDGNGVPSGIHSTAAPLRNLISHESGHGVGLGHADISGADAVMEGGLQSHFFGLQFDDIYAFNRLYGDPREKNGGNDNMSTSFNLGTVSANSSYALGTDAVDSVVEEFDDDWLGIDGSTDEDWFRFHVPQAAVADISVMPVGPTYQLSGQTFQATHQSNLQFELYRSDGTLMRTANSDGLGASERLNSQTFREPGDYFIRVTGTEDQNQFYQFDMTVEMPDLVLTVNRDTGEVHMSGLGTSGAGFDGYRIQSPSGSLNPSDGAWLSFADQNLLGWREANPTSTSVQELLPSGVAQLNNSELLYLGNFYSQNLTAPFGTPEESDITFSYLTPDSGEVWLKGAVEFVGDPFYNNLVLTVDPTTGQAALANESNTTIQLEGYSISSASGSLDPLAWNSLDDQSLLDWREANPSQGTLSELKPSAGMTLLPNDVLSLGHLFDVQGAQDLQLTFLLEGDAAFRPGVVTYEQLLSGDFDANGDVDGRDFLIWQRQFGSTVPVPGGGADGNGDGFVDATDLAVWQSSYGTIATTSSVAVVPEPRAWMLFVVFGICYCQFPRFTKLAMTGRQRGCEASVEIHSAISAIGLSE